MAKDETVFNKDFSLCTKDFVWNVNKSLLWKLEFKSYLMKKMDFFKILILFKLHISCKGAIFKLRISWNCNVPIFYKGPFSNDAWNQKMKMLHVYDTFLSKVKWFVVQIKISVHLNELHLVYSWSKKRNIFTNSNTNYRRDMKLVPINKNYGLL